jgi:hypothetical protein
VLLLIGQQPHHLTILLQTLQVCKNGRERHAGVRCQSLCNIGEPVLHCSYSVTVALFSLDSGQPCRAPKGGAATASLLMPARHTA